MRPLRRSAGTSSCSARAPALQGYTPFTYPFFWNTSLKS